MYNQLTLDIDLKDNNKLEMTYSNTISQEHIKKFGQYFTDERIAEFMVKWACKDAKNALDPAVGNSIFLKKIMENYKNCILEGYEIDKKILDFFGNPAKANIHNSDYLTNDWDKKYDAIVCNPPYNKFQSIDNRKEIIEKIFNNTGIRFSSYSNLYIYFLLKSIYQLSTQGKLAYIIPTEFLNSKYGEQIKEILIEKRLINAIINFENDSELFYNATTTSCILLLDKSIKSEIKFYNLKAIDELNIINEELSSEKYCIKVKYESIRAKEKWRCYLKHENNNSSNRYKNIKKISEFCSVKRGIATGDNAFFCLSKSKMEKYKIPIQSVSNCICKSADISNPIFQKSDFDTLKEKDKTVFLLDINENEEEMIKDYISIGIKEGVNKKYLPANRKKWYIMEKKDIAPIWVSSACRDKIKFIRNLTNSKSLTTFHSIFVNKNYEKDTDLIFCYFLTPIAQSLINDNRKELGNGLNKFQPNDLNSANMLDLDIITKDDKQNILNIYGDMKRAYNYNQIEKINDIIAKYVK